MRRTIVLLLALVVGCTERRLPDPDEVPPALVAQREAQARQEAERVREAARARQPGFE
ncbi:hypothetical protein [Limnoglobus roseus]|uniref:Uncharacterized protein n=1 Tax=Limnoglobus roseus TaxID=2598579 RepID=A0A5C1AJW2_9BACT|nr:hypothetical protein [Limnoglobus roseus]QEL17434.1 hypothetical protein PX52LOC_04423 [Limnoglobus roseus]